MVNMKYEKSNLLDFNERIVNEKIEKKEKDL